MTNLFITGVPAVGKTSLCKYVTHKIPDTNYFNYGEFFSKYSNLSMEEIDEIFVKSIEESDLKKLNLIDSHGIQKEDNGYIKTPFRKDHIGRLNLEAIYLIDAEVESIIARQNKDNKLRIKEQTDELIIHKSMIRELAEEYSSISNASLIDIHNRDFDEAKIRFLSSVIDYHLELSADVLLNTIFKSNDYYNKWFSSEILGRRKLEPHQIKKMKKLLKNRDIGEVIAWGLGNMNTRGIEKELSEGLYSDDTYMIWRCAEALRDIGSKEAINCLTKPIYDKNMNQETKWRCIWALGELKDVNSFEAIWYALKDESKYVKWEATKALIKLEEKINEKIYYKLKNTEDDYLIWRGVFILSKQKSKENLMFLEEIYENIKNNKYLAWQLSKCMEGLIDEENKNNNNK